MGMLTEYIRKTCYEKNITLKQFADQAGISFATLWEIRARGKTNLRFETMKRLAKVMGVEVSQVATMLPQ